MLGRAYLPWPSQFRDLLEVANDTEPYNEKASALCPRHDCESTRAAPMMAIREPLIESHDARSALSSFMQIGFHKLVITRKTHLPVELALLTAFFTLE